MLNDAHPTTVHAGPGARTPGRRRTRHIVFVSIAALIVAADQITKAIVRATLDRGDSWPDGWVVQFTHVTNSGAAFGALQGQTMFLVITTVLGIGALVIYYVAPPVQHVLAGPSLALVMGGAVGNLIDRVRVGRVTDFIDFPGYPKFNIADSAVTIGVMTLLLLVLLADDPAPEDEHEPGNR